MTSPFPGKQRILSPGNLNVSRDEVEGNIENLEEKIHCSPRDQSLSVNNYLSSGIICSERRAVFPERSNMRSFENCRISLGFFRFSWGVFNPLTNLDKSRAS